MITENCIQCIYQRQDRGHAEYEKEQISYVFMQMRFVHNKI